MNFINSLFEHDVVAITLFWIAMLLCFFIQYTNYVRDVGAEGSRSYWNKIIGFFILEAVVVLLMTPKLLSSGSRNNYVCYSILAVIIIETFMEWMTHKERQAIRQKEEATEDMPQEKAA